MLLLLLLLMLLLLLLLLLLLMLLLMLLLLISLCVCGGGRPPLGEDREGWVAEGLAAGGGPSRITAGGSFTAGRGEG